MIKILLIFTILLITNLCMAQSFQFECLTGKPELVAYDDALFFTAHLNSSINPPIITYKGNHIIGTKLPQGFRFNLNLKKLSLLIIRDINYIGTGMSYSEAWADGKKVYCL